MARCLLRSFAQVTSRINCITNAAISSKFSSTPVNLMVQNLRNAQVPHAYPFYDFNQSSVQGPIKGDPATKKDLLYIDPILIHQSFERLDPFAVADRSCPSFNVNKIINDGNLKQAPLQLANIIIIRRRKMKRHKLKKLKRKNLFLWRKVRLARRKVKEQKMVDYEKEMANWARDYNPEAEIEAELKRARDAGWFIDIVADRNNKQQFSK